MTSYTAAFEQTHTPELYKMQLKFANRVQDLKSKAASLVTQGSRETHKAAAAISPWIEERVGLNLTSKPRVQPRSDD